MSMDQLPEVVKWDDLPTAAQRDFAAWHIDGPDKVQLVNKPAFLSTAWQVIPVDGEMRTTGFAGIGNTEIESLRTLCLKILEQGNFQ